MTTERIKQIIPIEQGWTFVYLVETDGKVSVETLRVTGQALVESTVENDIDISIEAIVFDDGVFDTASHIFHLYYEGSNTYPLGLKEPGYIVSTEEIRSQSKRLQEKKKELSEKISKS